MDQIRRVRYRSFSAVHAWIPSRCAVSRARSASSPGSGSGGRLIITSVVLDHTPFFVKSSGPRPIRDHREHGARFFGPMEQRDQRTIRSREALQEDAKTLTSTRARAAYSVLD